MCGMVCSFVKENTESDVVLSITYFLFCVLAELLTTIICMADEINDLVGRFREAGTSVLKSPVIKGAQTC